MGTEQPEVEHEQALAVGTSPSVGRFRLDLADDSWWWSDEIYAMHGFERGEVVPSTELMATHKHPDDRKDVDHVVRNAVSDREPFSSVHRIVDAHGAVRTVAVVGRAELDDAGDPTAVTGYFVDLTAAQQSAGQAQATEAIRAAAASRGTIEQAKGIVMAARGGDANAAFDVLRETGSRRETRLRVVAEELVAAVAHRSADDGPLTADELDRLLAEAG
ncbi:PAS and ANTAR domain-containing protein [Luteimicrobium xylanilyticum]|uniref:histidine kinase n=1 Tax=Luteimicrobium xylanilyticum TaxID=1133546 RepID=A0A5P9Q9M3_9MICO|nr:PAS and ANTAR domain-containing protein [Luteimicrobium xylanilyticum]QFU98127.1 Protein-glutamate O-methyltransferase [Luteimicrobium xylanilyticum]